MNVASWVSDPQLKKRIAIGLPGAVLLVALLAYGDIFGAMIIGAVISLAMLYEFIQITFRLPDKAEKRNVVLGVSWLAIFLNPFMPRAQFELLLFLFFALFGYFLYTAKRYEGPDLQAHFQELMYAVFGSLYLVFLAMYLPMLRDSAGGMRWTILFFLIVWASDVGAYFAGQKYGKKKLYAEISPKKTLEGVYGGLGLSVVVSVIYWAIFFRGVSLIGILITTLVVVAFGVVGDLCESFLKRAFDVKDSGSLLPGHGGFLDRFDAWVFGLPAMYACVRLFSSG